MKLFEQNVSRGDEFTQWCNKALSGLQSSVDSEYCEDNSDALTNLCRFKTLFGLSKSQRIKFLTVCVRMQCAIYVLLCIVKSVV